MRAGRSSELKVTATPTAEAAMEICAHPTAFRLMLNTKVRV